MTPYISKSGKKSGVTAYEISETYIAIEMRGKETYLFTYESAGVSAVEQMKILAYQSRGLSTFISKNKPIYLKKS